MSSLYLVVFHAVFFFFFLIGLIGCHIFKQLEVLTMMIDNDLGSLVEVTMDVLDMVERLLLVNH